MTSFLFLKFPFASRYGGGERHTVLLVQELLRRGARCSFLGSCSVLLGEFQRRQWPARRFWAGKEPVSWWSILVFPLTAPVVALTLSVVILWYRLAQKVTVVACLSLTEKIIITPFARLCGMRVVWLEHVEVRRWLSMNPWRFLYTWWSHIATVLVISRVIQEQLVRLGVPERRVHVVYNGVDVHAYEEPPRRMFHWTQRFLIGTVARLEPEKGVSVLLRAFRELLTVIPHSQLIVVGDGSQRRTLEWLSRQLDIERKVQWVGFQQNIPQWMKTFDCFVLPSTGRESFGIVLLEAMASGCPVVASNIGGIPEIITNNHTGILVEPGDVELLMRAILFLYRHPDTAMALGQRGRENVKQSFSLDAALAKLIPFFLQPTT
jgi:glycosyltransferase involved in cell wall biosynthesis